GPRSARECHGDADWTKRLTRAAQVALIWRQSCYANFRTCGRSGTAPPMGTTGNSIPLTLRRVSYAERLGYMRTRVNELMPAFPSSQAIPRHSTGIILAAEACEVPVYCLYTREDDGVCHLVICRTPSYPAGPVSLDHRHSRGSTWPHRTPARPYALPL